MSEPINLQDRPEISAEALEKLPLFPLSGVLLLPETVISLHIFEPRYRRMLEDIADSHRVLAIAMFNERGLPDTFGRPPLFPVAGVGVLRRSAKLPDGRFNVVVEGVLRANIEEELSPELSCPYRRARARALVDQLPKEPGELQAAVSALRSLCVRVVSEMAGTDHEILGRLNEITDPSTLADMVAAATAQDSLDRERILCELSVTERLSIASGLLGALFLRVQEGSAPKSPVGWGVGRGSA